MATLSDFGVPGGGQGILHPKQRNRYRVLFSGIGMIENANGQDLTVQAITCGRPEIDFEEVALHRYNSVDYIAGKHSFNPISMTVEDDITGLASAVIKSQLESQERLVGTNLDGRWVNSAATGSDYKFGCRIEMLDGNEGVVEAWILESCWIKSAQFGDLDWSSGDAVKIQLTIRFGHARSLSSGDGYGTALGGFMNN